MKKFLLLSLLAACSTNVKSDVEKASDDFLIVLKEQFMPQFPETVAWERKEIVTTSDGEVSIVVIDLYDSNKKVCGRLAQLIGCYTTPEVRCGPMGWWARKWPE